MLSNIDLPDNCSGEEKTVNSIFSPPGKYLSPASLDGTTSITSGNSVTNRNLSNPNNRNPINLPSPLSFLNGSVNQLQKIMTSSPSHILSNSATSTPGTLSDNNSLSAIKVENGVKPSTSVSSTVADDNGNIVKRKYSRNGCTECKRRRMKCDESKPTCWQCARLNRECVYVLNPKNKKRKNADKKVVNKNSPQSNNMESSLSPEITNNLANNENINTITMSAASSLISQSPVSNTINIPNTISSNQTDLSKAVSDSVPNSVLATSIDGINTNLLMQNLNDIVNMKLNDSFMLNEELKDLNLPDLDIPELLMPSASHHSTVPISFLVNSIIQFNIKITAFKLGGMHDEYLRVFYNDCLDTIAPFFQNQGNPLRDILLSFARNESYLLSAILAVGASISHRKTNKFHDERNYCAYLSHCLSLLGEQFHNESNVLNKIEPIILTVMLLAWDCINTMNSQWRSHLKGVTDLFKKINSGNSSKVLNVAKCWFKVIETFASISTDLGGSLNDDDLDVIFDPYDYQYVDSLKFLNVMTPLNEFNLLRGHKEDFDLVIRDVIKGLNYIRDTTASLNENNNETKKDGDSSITSKDVSYLMYSSKFKKLNSNNYQLSFFQTQRILVEIDRQLEYEFINKTGVIPRESQSHPDNSGIEDNAIDIVNLCNGETIAISWYDISHQTQVLSFLLIVLLRLLGIPKESRIIQDVVKKLMSFFKFLDSDDPPRNSRTCYSNFAVLLAGINAMEEETRDIVRQYYKLNGKDSRRLTDYNLQRLEKEWYGKPSNGDNLEHRDVLTW